MATKIWKGDAQGVAQVDTLTVGGTVEVGDLFTVKVGNRTISVAATTISVDTTAGDIAAAIVNFLTPEFASLTAADTSATTTGTLTITGASGVPFTLTVSTTEAGGGAADLQTFTKASTTTATGPAFWDNADNWDTGTIPVSTDDVVIENSSRSILYGLSQSAVALTSLVIRQSFTGTIGLPEFATTLVGSYEEYRAKYLQVGATSVEIGEGAGSGSGRIRLDNGSANTTVLVHNTGTTLETGVPTLLWKCTNIGSDVTINKGHLGVAFYAGEAAAIDKLKMAFRTNVKTDTTVVLGAGVTALVTVAKSGGSLQLATSTTAIAQVGTAGDTAILGGTHTAILVYGGTISYLSVGAITTLALQGATAVADFSKDARNRTVTNTSMFPGASLLDPSKTVTFTNPISINGKLSEMTLDLGTDFNLQRS